MRDATHKTTSNYTLYAIYKVKISRGKAEKFKGSRFNSSNPVTTPRRRCVSCSRGVIVRRIYAPLKLISSNNKPGREVTKGARSQQRHRVLVAGHRTPPPAER